jgi:DNA gyrase/topoisomerase IV subunit A
VIRKELEYIRDTFGDKRRTEIIWSITKISPSRI